MISLLARVTGMSGRQVIGAGLMIDDYYWVPGTWVLAPEVGLLWTPGYWGWGGDAFLWHEGYWGPQVGFYGGIDYGFGYFGVGFVGGRWDNGRFLYNRAVSNVDFNVTRNVYNEEVTNVNVNRVSFNGGNGGIDARPTPQKKPRNAAAIFHRSRPRCSTRKSRAAIQSCALRRILASRLSPRLLVLEHSKMRRPESERAGAPYNVPANRAVGMDRTDLRATRSAPLHAKDLPAIRVRPHQTLATRSWIRSTCNSRTTLWRNRRWNASNCSGSRIRSTSGWRNKHPTTKRSNNSSSSIGSKRNR